jgi:hypothetical protein
MNDTTPPPLLWTPRECAAQLQISERSLWALTAPRGPLRAVHLGRLIRYAPADVASFIAASKGDGQ